MAYISKPLADRPELTKLMRESVAKFAAMTTDEQEALLREQRDGWVTAEMSWPKDCPYR